MERGWEPVGITRTSPFPTFGGAVAAEGREGDWGRRHQLLKAAMGPASVTISTSSSVSFA